MRKLLAILACSTCVIGLHPSQSSAQFQVGGHLGIDFESSDIFIGPHVLFDLPVELPDDDFLKLNPEFSYYLSDSGVEGVSSSFWLVSATALYPLEFEFASTYFGAGVVLAHSSFDVDVGFTGKSVALQQVSESSTDVGLNLKGGGEFGEAGARPFGEAGFVISESSWFYVQGGIRFGFGSD